MLIETINAHVAIRHFLDLINAKSKYRFLFIGGDGNLGKSHLVAKLFPLIWEQHYKVCWTLVDLRGKPQSTADILMQIATQLRKNILLKNFDAALEKWIDRDNFNVEDIKTIFTTINITAKSSHNKIDWGIYLTQKLVLDIESVPDLNILFIFDQYDSANKLTQVWLRESLLVQLKSLSNVRVVVSGRSIPPILHTYTLVSIPHNLSQVRDDAEYIKWCREKGIREELLSDQSIKDFARLLEYQPGLFASHVLAAFTNNI